jgi:hypothetical protein
MAASQPISTSIHLTPEQKNALASALGIDVRHIPDQLGIVGMPLPTLKTLGVPDTMKAKFSPALMMM